MPYIRPESKILTKTLKHCLASYTIFMTVRGNFPTCLGALGTLLIRALVRSGVPIIPELSNDDSVAERRNDKG